METLTGDYVATNKKDYYYFYLNLGTGEVVRIKNASCAAKSNEMFCGYSGLNKWDEFKTFRRFFNGSNPDFDLNNVSKKFHKAFKALTSISVTA